MRTVALPLLALAACGPIQIEPAQEYCSDFDPDLTEEDAMVEVLDDEVSVTISRSPVYRGRQDALELTASIEGRYLLIRESWSERAGEEEICWEPTVDIYDLPSGQWNVEWYLETEAKPSYETSFTH